MTGLLLIYLFIALLYFIINHYRLGGNEFYNLIVAVFWPIEFLLWVAGSAFVYLEEKEMKKIMEKYK